MIPMHLCRADELRVGDWVVDPTQPGRAARVEAVSAIISKERGALVNVRLASQSGAGPLEETAKADTWVMVARP